MITEFQMFNKLERRWTMIIREKENIKISILNT